MPDEFIADPQSGDKDGTILITVDGATSTYTARYGTIVRPFQIKNPTTSQPVATATVVIESLLPNPHGDDEQLEAVTLRNRGTSAVSLAGWVLRDRSSLTWTLSSSLNPGQSFMFRRNGQGMSLNNAGDEIVLIDATQVERDRFGYWRAVATCQLDALTGETNLYPSPSGRRKGEPTDPEDGAAAALPTVHRSLEGAELRIEFRLRFASVARNR